MARKSGNDFGFKICATELVTRLCLKLARLGTRRSARAEHMPSKHEGLGLSTSTSETANKIVRCGGACLKSQHWGGGGRKSSMSLKPG